MAKNFYDGPWSWILAALTGIPFPAFKDAVTDEYGANAVDREYVAYLKRMVENGELTEEEARKKLADKGYNGKGTSDEFYDSVGSDVGSKEIGGAAGSSVATGLTGVLSSLVAYFTRNQLTGAEREQNAFNAGEAQLSRDFTEYMARNKYTMETQSMQDAGVNPAMVYGGGNLVPTAANGAAASGSPIGGGNVADLLSTLVRMPLELKAMQAEIARSKADAKRAEQEGNAAETNAAANKQNAETNARNAATQERLATVQEMRQQVDAAMAESNMSLNEAQKTHLAKQCSILEKQYLQMDELLDLEKVKASAQEKQALASLKQAAAAIQNARTNDYLSNYQTSLMYAQELLTWADGEGKEIVNKYLDDRQKEELANIRKQGLNLDAEFRLINAQRKATDAQTVRTYINCGTDIANSVSRFIGINAIKGGVSDVVSAKGAQDFANALNYYNVGQSLHL